MVMESEIKYRCLDCGNVFCKLHMKKHEKNFHIEKNVEGDCIVCRIMNQQ